MLIKRTGGTYELSMSVKSDRGADSSPATIRVHEIYVEIPALVDFARETVSLRDLMRCFMAMEEMSGSLRELNRQLDALKPLEASKEE